MKQHVILILFSITLTVSGIYYRECQKGTDTVGRLVSVSISGCKENDVCAVPIGSNVTLTIKFNALTEITDATPHVHAHIFGIRIPAPPGFSEEIDACKQFDKACPIEGNTDVVYTTTVFVQPYVPQLYTVVEWEVVDQKGATIVCFFVPLRIVSKQ